MYKLLILTILLACLSVGTSSPVAEDAACEWDGVKGKCVFAYRCLTTLDKRAETKNPVCSEDGEEVKICCTDCELVNDTRNVVISPTGGGLFWKDGRPARDHCLEYLDTLSNNCHGGFYGGISRAYNKEKKCHIYNMWAVGGAPPPGVVYADNPYEVLIGFGEDKESAQWLTSGTIISDKFILTSPNVDFASKDKLPLKFVAAGVTSRKDKENWQIIKVKKVVHHPDWTDDETRAYNALTLVELETPIKFNTDVHPACLPDPTDDFNIKDGEVSSWKVDGLDATSFSDEPTKVEVSQLTAQECSDQFGDLSDGVNDATQLCYGNKDTCIHTIGSAVVMDTQISRCIDTVVGVSSYGNACGPVVFTKVANFVPWIESIVWPKQA